jgi:competence protein ComGC
MREHLVFTLIEMIILMFISLMNLVMKKQSLAVYQAGN